LHPSVLVDTRFYTFTPVHDRRYSCYSLVLAILILFFQSDKPYEVIMNFTNVSPLQTQTMLLRMDCFSM